MRAIWHRAAKALKPFMFTDVDQAAGNELFELQLWRYDPVPLQKDGCVDPISLGLSLNDVIWDRVQAALDNGLIAYPDYVRK